MFGSIVGIGVSVGAGRVAVGVTVSTTGGNVPVGVQGIGWKGVGVGEALGAAVTNVNGRADEVGAYVPHPARRDPARSVKVKNFFIRYGGDCWEGNAVSVGVSVGMNVDVALGGGSVAVLVLVTGAVVFVGDEVSVGKSGMIVTPGTGVRVGMLGTHSLCPA